MSIFSYLVLLTIVLVLLCVIAIIAVTFRSCIAVWCCSIYRAGTESDSTDQANDPATGNRNLGFDAQEEIRNVRPRPFSPMEQTECPPSYEEAIQQELFRFRFPPTPIQRHTESVNNSENSQTASLQTEEVSARNIEQPGSSQQNSPRRLRQSRDRSSTSANNVLSTINEEDGEWPVQVIIDCIGVQTARLIENCDTTVHLTDGTELNTKSEC